MSNIITGTIAELVARKLCVNGVKGDQPYISFLVRIGALKPIGNVENGKKGRGGKTAAVFSIDLDQPITFSMVMTASEAVH